MDLIYHLTKPYRYVGIITGNNFAAKFREVQPAQMNCQVL